MIKNSLPENDGSCNTPIEANLELAKKIRYILDPNDHRMADGKRIEGALPHEDIVKYIEVIFFCKMA
jgi:hypothetical protein